MNFSQNTKLIKLNNIDHVYNIVGQKPNDQFHKIKLESSKTPNLNRSENPNKMHEFMHENMKINAKGRVKRSYQPWERKTLQKEWRKETKKFDWSLDQVV